MLKPSEQQPLQLFTAAQSMPLQYEAEVLVSKTGHIPEIYNENHNQLRYTHSHRSPSCTLRNCPGQAEKKLCHQQNILPQMGQQRTPTEQSGT